MATTYYLWNDDANVMCEYDATFDQKVGYTQKPGQYGGVISQHRDGDTSHYHADGLGNTSELPDSSGNVTDTNRYDAWGTQVSHTGTTENPYRWRSQAGYYYDEVSGQYYVRARTYSPTIGRWLSVDPLGFVDGLNRYVAYFVPGRVDPNGMAARGENNCDYCGPDATSLLISEIIAARDHFHTQIDKYINGSTLYFAWYRAVSRWTFMSQIGNTLDWQYIASDPCLDPPALSCPTKRCQRSYRQFQNHFRIINRHPS